MAEILVVLNGPPYGTEQSYNGLRLAAALVRREGTAVRVFLTGDAVVCAKQGQKVPQGYYNMEVLLHAVVRAGGEVGVCGSCIDARGLHEPDLVPGCHRSSLEQLADWTLASGKVLVF